MQNMKKIQHNLQNIKFQNTKKMKEKCWNDYIVDDESINIYFDFDKIIK